MMIDSQLRPQDRAGSTHGAETSVPQEAASILTAFTIHDMTQIEDGSWVYPDQEQKLSKDGNEDDDRLEELDDITITIP